MKQNNLTAIIIVGFYLISFATCCVQAPFSNGNSIETLGIDASDSVRTDPTLAPVITPTDFVEDNLDLDWQSIRIWREASVPDGLWGGLGIKEANVASISDQADISIGISYSESHGVDWIYALAAPFNSLVDEISISDLKNIWNGTDAEDRQLLLDPSTLASITSLFGTPSDFVKIYPTNDLLKITWNNPNSYAIVPFELLEPRWKVIAIDGESPIRNDFNAENYKLKVRFGWIGDPPGLSAVENAISSGMINGIKPNRDSEKMTTLVMTGVTALVRATAVRMEQNGVNYPSRDIRDWLVNADITHISNEVSFSPDCPDPLPSQAALIFCAKPEYMDLFDYIGVDVIELTGNHEVDWGWDALKYSLNLYREHGWVYYAAGNDVANARAAATIEHNSNRFAFIGCNPAGPPMVWAGENRPGVANCDYPWLQTEIKRLTADGYIVIATLQYYESYRHYAENFERNDFRILADAGAVIVSGSQSHHPMEMEFFGKSFIHYGLGNLFFDQMYYPTTTLEFGTRKEFIDRHVFYDGKHISTELLTAFLEDFSRPRPMITEEREKFLREIFSVAKWDLLKP